MVGKRWIGKINSFYKKSKEKVHFLVGGVVVVLVLTTITEKTTENMQGENEKLRIELYKYQMRMNVMHQIMLQQQDSIDMYKTYLIDCQQNRLNENSTGTR